MTRARRALASALLGLLVFAAPSALAKQGSLQTGFTDSVYADADAGTRAAWLDRTRNSEASIVRIDVSWRSVAPGSRSRAFHAGDPASPGYSWQRTDEAVRDARRAGLHVLLTFTSAPAWAEGAHRQADAPAGTWRPRPRALGAFARALAHRYSGRFRDPATGEVLPRVSRFQVWNEPNLYIYLTPQGGARGRPIRSAPHYRLMLRAAYRGIKSAHRDNVVVAAGHSPYGDETGSRTRPVRFWRGRFCLAGQGLRRLPCAQPALLDAVAHHPYAIGGPYRHTFSKDDMSIPDVWRLTRVARAAVRSGRALPRRPKPLWITEVGWDSKPPDPNGVSSRTHARWLSQAFWVLWRQGASVISWFQIRDQDTVPDFFSTAQSGVYFRDGRPKLAQRAFRFPFASERRARSKIRIWGKAPHSGRVLIEATTDQGWRVIARVRTGRSNIFTRTISVKRKIRLRARQGTRVSLSHLRA